MGLNCFQPLTISEIENAAAGVVNTTDLFQVMAKVASSKGHHTISLRQSGAEIDEEIVPSRMPTSDDYSLWARYGIKWHYIVVGAASLDDIFFEFVEAIQDGKADEIRICPPGCPQPRAL